MKKLNIIKKTITTKKGKSFDTFKVLTKRGKLVDLHFRKGVELPQESCIAYVEDKDFNTNISATGYPECWIKGVDHYEELKSQYITRDDFADASEEV